MASTEQRTGFRFGWGSRGESEKPTEQPEQSAAETTDPASVSGATESHSAPTPFQPPAANSWPSADVPEATGATTSPPAESRQSGFLGELMRAMQAAAEQNRKQLMDRFHDDARAFIETVRSRSTDEVNELRRTSEADVTAIREWSKAEIARIKSETDERIEARRGDLERQLEGHQDLVDREIQKLETRINAFEQQMEGFFNRLQAVTDATAFATVAQQMPEPPSVEILGTQARAEALAEVSLGGGTRSEPRRAPEPAQWSSASASYDTGRSAAAETPEKEDRTASPPEHRPSADDRGWSTAEESATIAPQSIGAWGEPAQPVVTEPKEETSGSPFGQRFSDADPQASWSTAERQAATETATLSPGTPPSDQIVYGAPASLAAEALSSEWGSVTAPAVEPYAEQAQSGGSSAAAATDLHWPGAAAETDPRLAALGMAPAGTSADPTAGAFTRPDEPSPARYESTGLSEPAVVGEQTASGETSTAEPATAAAAAPPTPASMPGEAFTNGSASSPESTAAQLAGLVPSSEIPANGRTVANTSPAPTQVIVTGLLSVASIASFKRHLSRIPGVQAVGVSSGPEGEFIFKTTHDAGVPLADVIPALPGFGAEIVGKTEGTISVAAHDPEADA